LSILPPAAAPAFANEICQLIREHSPDTVFVDCNAISPDTVRHIATIAGDNNVRFQDVGIVGAAPRDDRMPVRFYSSGPWNDEVRQLATAHIEVCEVGEDTGRASAIKMVYASVTNATHSLRAAAAIAAERLGISEELHAEWQHSLPGTYESMQQRFPRLAADADRWAGEMHEIAQTYRSVGLTPAFHEGAAWMFEALAATALGEESRHEAIGHSRSMHEVVEIWSETISVDV
jgi:3-hydroxyisobutyrate dehydrogenase-like beta-hydroxyacid dehydrogenase